MHMQPLILNLNSRKIDLNPYILPLGLTKKLVRCYVWNIALYGSETWTLRKSKQKYLENFKNVVLEGMDMIKWSENVCMEKFLNV